MICLPARRLSLIRSFISFSVRHSTQLSRLTIMEAQDLFKDTFKYYKSKSWILNEEDAIDFEVPENYAEKIASYTSELTIPRDRLVQVGLEDPKNWAAFTVKDIPGLIFIRNPFTVVGQRYWVSRSCRDFPKQPNRTNLSLVNESPENDWWTLSTKVDKSLADKLRWTTLGYHHNWDTKIYSESNKSPFPIDLERLTRVVAAYVGYPTFHPEAAIINYYYMDSTLSGHTDRSEVDLQAPLFSFSFGHSAVFLIGGKEKCVKPQAMLIKSGDVIVMCGESRLCYHGVPRILPTTYNPWLPKLSAVPQLNHENGEEQRVRDGNKLKDFRSCPKFWTPFQEYIQKSRINMNIRQVLPEGQTSL